MGAPILTAWFAAEEWWPAIAAVERLAYRTLSTCWALEQLGNEAAREAAAAMFVNDGAGRVRGAIDGVVAAIFSGSAFPPLPPLPHVLETELADLGECLQRYAPSGTADVEALEGALVRRDH
jgi:hypothetical protein